MNIKPLCGQYFNAYENLGNGENNDTETCASLASYLSIAAPFIAFIAYSTIILYGRMSQKFEPSNLDVKTLNLYNKTAVPSPSLDLDNDIQEFFQYFKPSEIDAIQHYFNHPLQDEISTCIAEGNWNGLIDCYNRTKYHVPFYKILDGIFLQGKNDRIDDLVTAYMAISNSECDFNNSCKMVSYDDAIKSGQWKDLDKRLANTNGVSNNQLIFFEIALDTMSSSKRSLIKAFFDTTNRDNHIIGGFEHEKNTERFLISSAALMRKDTRLSGSLKFINRMPKRSTVIKYLLEKRTHIISLFQPEEEANINIHGQHPTGLLCFIHDGFHANARAECNLLEMKELLETGLLITDVLKTLPKYTSDMAVSEEDAYRGLTPAATEDDKVRFFLEEIVQHIIDAENLAYSYTKGHNCTTAEHLESMLSSIQNNDHSLISFIQGRLPKEFNKFGYNIIPKGYGYPVIKN